MRTSRAFTIVFLLTLLVGYAAPVTAQEPAVAVAPQQPAQPPPEPPHTGFSALVHETAANFRAWPRRRSTWVILGVGGAAALLVHPADDSLNARISGSHVVGRVFAPGKY